MNRDILVPRLATQGYDLLQACDGEEALDALPEAEWDLLLTDIVMPGVTVMAFGGGSWSRGSIAATDMADDTLSMSGGVINADAGCISPSQLLGGVDDGRSSMRRRMSSSCILSSRMLRTMNSSSRPLVPSWECTTRPTCTGNRRPALSRMCRGRSPGWISWLGARTTMLSTRLRSSRTFPGHGYCINRSMASDEIPWNPRSRCFE